jgi:hypothetical protein
MDEITFRTVDEMGYPEFLFLKKCHDTKIVSRIEYSYKVNQGAVCKKNLDKLKAEVNLLHERIDVDFTVSEDENSYEAYRSVFMYKNTPIFLQCRDYNYVQLSVGRTDVKGQEKQEAEILALLRKYVPPYKHKSSDAYNIDFWFYGQTGAKSKSREFNESALTDIIHNYNAKDKEQIELLKTFHPTKGGELLLLTGEAGVGKSNLLLSLFREWKDWATFNYILDPATFFSGNPAYVLDMVLSKATASDDDDSPSSSGEDFLKSFKRKISEKDKWRVFILEDCGEMLGMDAKEKQGQALSMFLNITDGFIGKGTKTIVIVTTNEEIGKLHPAVSRPGRCAFHHKFGLLSVKESEVWLKNKKRADLVEKVTRDMTLAELYSLLNKDSVLSDPAPKRKKMGFSPE